MIKKIVLTLFIYGLIFSEAFAISLYDALTSAFKNNTELNAERENIDVAKEDLNISRSN